MAFAPCIDEIEVVLEENDVSVEERTRCLVIGKIISDRELNRGAVISQLRRIWTVIEAPIIKQIDANIYGISFRNERILEIALAEAPHRVNCCCMTLHRWSREKSIHELDLNKISFWIQMHNVPLNFASLKNVKAIGAKLGTLVEAEDPLADGVGRGFLRARVELDARYPLRAKMWLPSSAGKRIEVLLKYEKLQEFCFCCGRLGHTLKRCGDSEAHSCISYKSDLRTQAILIPMVGRDDFRHQSKEVSKPEQQVERLVAVADDPYKEDCKMVEFQKLFSEMREEMVKLVSLIKQRDEENAQLKILVEERYKQNEELSELNSEGSLRNQVTSNLNNLSNFEPAVVNCVVDAACLYKVDYPDDGDVELVLATVKPSVSAISVISLTAGFVRMNLKRKFILEEVNVGSDFEGQLGGKMRRRRVANGEKFDVELMNNWEEGIEKVKCSEGIFEDAGIGNSELNFQMGSFSGRTIRNMCRRKRLKVRKEEIYYSNEGACELAEGDGGKPEIATKLQ